MSHEDNFELLKNVSNVEKNETRKASIDFNDLKKGK